MIINNLIKIDASKQMSSMDDIDEVDSVHPVQGGERKGKRGTGKKEDSHKEKVAKAMAVLSKKSKDKDRKGRQKETHELRVQRASAKAIKRKLKQTGRNTLPPLAKKQKTSHSSSGPSSDSGASKKPKFKTTKGSFKSKARFNRRK